MASRKSSRVNPKYETEYRGGWRKLHLGVDDEGFIVAQALTESTGDDAAMLPELLSQVDAPVNRFTGDGAYDRRSTYEQIGEVGYRQQARVEGTFLRYKRTLGSALPARGFEAQAKESMIGCNILNRLLQLGRSDSVAVTG